MAGDDIHSPSLLPKQGYSFTVLVGSLDIRAQMHFVNTNRLVWYHWSLLTGGYCRKVEGCSNDLQGKLIFHIWFPMCSLKQLK